MSVGAREEDRDRIVGSFETIIQAILGRELEDLRRAVSELGSETAQHIDNLKRETAGNVEALRATMAAESEATKREVRSALDQLREEVFAGIDSSRQDAAGSTELLKEKVATSIEEFRTRAATIEQTLGENRTEWATREREIDERAEQRIQTTTDELQRRVDDAVERLRQEVSSLSTRVDSASEELQTYIATSSRVSDVLDSLGDVLAKQTSDPSGAAHRPAVATPDEPLLPTAEAIREQYGRTPDSPAEQHVAPDTPDDRRQPPEFDNKAELEVALERVFPLTKGQ